MILRKKTWIAATISLLALGSPARADIYGYIDEDGGAHFSNIPQDKRYTVFLRTPRTEPPARASRQGGRTPAVEGAVGSVAARRRAYNAAVAGLAAALQVDAALLHAVITAESGYNPRARSDKGAMGLMQLMPDTARRYCVNDPYDPVQNLRGGSQYLRDLLQRYGNDTKLALAAYNAGEGAVDRYGGQIPPYRETRLYVPLVMGLYERYRKTPGLIKAASAEEPRGLGGRCG